MSDADAAPVRDLSIKGAVDTHVHSSPDVLPRAMDDISLVRSAVEAGLAGIVLKNHHSSTAARAQIAASMVDGIAVLGGIVLNWSSCGGFNHWAVRATLAMGGRVVWMPTISARNHIEYLVKGGASDHVNALSSLRGEPGLTPFGDDGKLLESVKQILDAIADADAVLATGHLSWEETCDLVEAAQNAGVTRILITHPEAPQIDMPLEVQCQLARGGAFLERCYYSVLEGREIREVISDIRSVGVESTILATDLGQSHFPAPVQGFADYRAALAKAGLPDSEWRTTAVDNPSRLLRLLER